MFRRITLAALLALLVSTAVATTVAAIPNDGIGEEALSVLEALGPFQEDSGWDYIDNEPLDTIDFEQNGGGQGGGESGAQRPVTQP